MTSRLYVFIPRFAVSLRGEAAVWQLETPQGLNIYKYIYIHIEYIYICAYKHIYIYAYTYTHTDMYLYICIYTYIHIHIAFLLYVYVYIYIHACTYVYIYIYVYRCIYMSGCVCIRLCISTVWCIHMYMHTMSQCICMKPPGVLSIHLWHWCRTEVLVVLMVLAPCHASGWMTFTTFSFACGSGCYDGVEWIWCLVLPAAMQGTI